MADWPLSEPLGTIIDELRAANVASKRVRGNEPGPNDAKNAGEYIRFVVISDLGGPRMHRAPVQTLRYNVRCYSATYQDASALYRQVSDLLDNAGPRYGVSSDVAIHQTLDTTGGAAGMDPVTKQPYYEGIFEVMAGAVALAS